jgi:hypothetical protein
MGCHCRMKMVCSSSSLLAQQARAAQQDSEMLKVAVGGMQRPAALPLLAQAGG